MIVVILMSLLYEETDTHESVPKFMRHISGKKRSLEVLASLELAL